jgi:hypothetical protein
VEWRNARQFTRVTSYSLRNSVEIPTSPTGPYVVPLDTPSTSRFTTGGTSTLPAIHSPLASTTPITRQSVSPKRTSSVSRPPLSADRRSSTVASPPPTSSSSSTKRRPPPLLARAPTRTRLSRLLSSTAPPPSPVVRGSRSDAAVDTTSFAAFKALPIDPARTCGHDGSTFVESAAPDEFLGTCREAVDRMVDCIVRACIDASGGDFAPVVRQEDIVRSAIVVFPSPSLLIIDSDSAWQRRRG